MNKSPRILVIANPSIPVPPARYGGAERIVHFLCEGLNKKGYSVDLIAASGSRQYGGNLLTYKPPGKKISNRIFERLKFYGISLRLLNNIDLVINFGRVDYLSIFLRANKKIINVFENPINQYEVDYLNPYTKNVRLVAVSKDQFSEINSGFFFNVIHNCADTDFLDYVENTKRDYFVFIGRLTRNKGVDKAIDLAKQANVKLKIAGPIPSIEATEDYTYYKEKIEPLIDGGQICHAGSLHDDHKNDFFAGALANLFPVQWKDPCPLTVCESLACGVPVIASNFASMPELIQHGVTGYLCDSDDEFLEAISCVSSLSNSFCRNAAEKRFSKVQLVSKYEKLIQNSNG